MKMFRTLDEADLKGKRVLLRVDLNVPAEDGTVEDITRTSVPFCTLVWSMWNVEE